MLLGTTNDYYDGRYERPQVAPTTSNESSSMMVANGGYQRGHARNELQLADFPSSDSGYRSKASQGVAQRKTISDSRNQLELATFPSSDNIPEGIASDARSQLELPSFTYTIYQKALFQTPEVNSNSPYFLPVTVVMRVRLHEEQYSGNLQSKVVMRTLKMGTRGVLHHSKAAPQISQCLPLI